MGYTTFMVVKSIFTAPTVPDPEICHLYGCTDSVISDPVYGDAYCEMHVTDFKYEDRAHQTHPHLF